MEDEYWGISFPGLTQAGAEQLLSFAESIDLDGYTVDPAYFYVREMGRGTVEILLPLLRAGLDATESDLSDRDRWGAESMIEDMGDWLQHAEAVESDQRLGD